MCKGLIGKKLGMTGIFSSEGKLIPVTVLQVGPCVVTQIKTKETDGYSALQIAFGAKKPSRMKNPMVGHLKKAGIESAAAISEVSVDETNSYVMGQVIGVDIFSVGDRVDVTGRTKGRGFAGVIKRHGFSGGRTTHGSKCHRIPGSIGTSAWPSRVMKGKKLPGHYGDDRKTIQNLEVVDVRPDENLVMLKGSVPGANSGIVVVRKKERAK